jgi:hypothetical protein
VLASHTLRQEVAQEVEVLLGVGVLAEEEHRAERHAAAQQAIQISQAR